MDLGGRLARVAATVACAWLSACAVSEDEDPVDAERRARADAIVALQCSEAQACDCAPTVAAAGCEAHLTDAWAARLRAGSTRGLEYDATCVDAIEAAIADVGCAWPGQGASALCRDFCQVFTGDRELAQTCEGFDELVSDCRQGLVCDLGRCVEPCTRLSGLAAGEICRDPDSGTELEQCAEGLDCLFSSSRCAKLPSAGEACLEGRCDAHSYCRWDGENANTCVPSSTAGQNCDNSQCDEGLTCEWNEFDVSTCQPLGQQGQPCDNGCVDGLSCGPSGTCMPPGDVGAPCDFGGCREGLVCDFDVALCKAPPAAGQPCLQGECERGAWCDASGGFELCVAGKAVAEPCTGHSQCETNYCPAGFCAQRPRIGESCAGTLVCGVGSSCDGQVCRTSANRGPAVCVYEGW